MSKQERADVMDVVKKLPDEQKQFLLGYAAGVSASAKADVKDKEATDEKRHS